MPRLASITILMVLTSAATAAPRVLDRIEGAYELALTDVRWPASTIGFVRLRSCATCKDREHGVDASTAYHVGDERVSLGDFSRRIDTLRAATEASRKVVISVFYDLESSLVTRVFVHESR